MTLYQFNMLDENEQAEAVWDGVRIGERHDEEHSILLYQLDSFYVEVFYDREHNVIRKFETLTEDQILLYMDRDN